MIHLSCMTLCSTCCRTAAADVCGNESMQKHASMYRTAAQRPVSKPLPMIVAAFNAGD